jgi:hypothetical protein
VTCTASVVWAAAPGTFAGTVAVLVVAVGLLGLVVAVRVGAVVRVPLGLGTPGATVPVRLGDGVVLTHVRVVPCGAPGTVPVAVAVRLGVCVAVRVGVPVRVPSVPPPGVSCGGRFVCA